MTFRFMMSAAASALLASVAMGAAGMATAQTQPAAADPILIAPGPDEAANTDNGVHAVPSGQVSETLLPGSSPNVRVSLPPRRLTVTRVEARAADPQPPSASPPRAAELANAEVSSAAPSPTAEPADVSPAPDVQSQPVIFQGRSAQLTALAPLPASVPDTVEQEADEPGAGAPDAVASAATPADAAAGGAPVAGLAANGPGPEEARAYGLVQSGAAPALTPISDVRESPARVIEEAPAEQPMQQHVSFPRRSVEAAAAFDAYMQSAAGLGVELKGGSDVAEALKTAAAYEPKQLEEGMIAYGAIAALQDARFVYAVMDAAADDRSRQTMVDAILQDPHAASRLPGAQEASSVASAAILREARPVILAGKALKQASYDVQRQSWSTTRPTDGPGRLSQAKAESSTHFSARDGDMARVLTRITTLKDDDYRAGSAGGEAASRSIALAALAILDGGRAQEDGGLQRLLSEYSTTECLKMAKLNLFQCLSVAGPEYEDVYCLGKHAVLDTGQCIAAAADPAETMQLSALSEPRGSR